MSLLHIQAYVIEKCVYKPNQTLCHCCCLPVELVTNRSEWNIFRRNCHYIGKSVGEASSGTNFHENMIDLDDHKAFVWKHKLRILKIRRILMVRSLTLPSRKLWCQQGRGRCWSDGGQSMTEVILVWSCRAGQDTWRTKCSQLLKPVCGLDSWS